MWIEAGWLALEVGERPRGATRVGGPRLLVGAPASLSGKTTVSLCLMAAFRRQGIRVQGFKVGPDYIDGGYHRAITGRPSRNLDLWMGDEGTVRQVFHSGSVDADLSIIEGVMGLYDGHRPDSDDASSAHVAKALLTPVLLVIDAQAMARSAAAIVKGFQAMDPEVSIGGVIANQVGSERHYHMVRQAIEDVTGVAGLGYLPRHDSLRIPERQLGLFPALERGNLDLLMDNLVAASQTLDLPRIYALAGKAPPIPTPPTPGLRRISGSVQVAVAHDDAFNFYYRENLDLLEQLGATLIYFSPLRGDPIPDGADALYIGGGFPEEFAPTLSRRPGLLAAYRRRIAGGLPTLAECGGFMWLAEGIRTADGRYYPMVGAIPVEVTMTSRLQAIGYRTIRIRPGVLLPGGSVYRGHEFHYSVVSQTHGESPGYDLTGHTGETPSGWGRPGLLAGYAHFYFPSNPEGIRQWLEALT